MIMFIIYVIGVLVLIGFEIGYAIKNPSNAAKQISDFDNFVLSIILPFVWPIVLIFAITWAFCNGIERIRYSVVNLLEKLAETKDN